MHREYYKPGDPWATCDQCGLKMRHSEAGKRWDGVIVHKDPSRGCMEQRHPQEFVRTVKDNYPLPFVRVDSDGIEPTVVFNPTITSQAHNDIPDGTFDESQAYIITPSSGSAANYISTPDTAVLDILGDIDIRIHVAMANWTTPSFTCFLSKWDGGTNQRSWVFELNTDRTLKIHHSSDGIGQSVPTSTAAVSYTDDTAHWLRVTIDVDNGASGRDVKFYTSEDGVTWTQLGSTVTTAGVTTLFNSNQPLQIAGFGAGGAGDPLRGKIYYAEVRNSIDGTVVASMSANNASEGPDTFVSGGLVWTLNGSNIHVVRELV